jgi:hypothetical protein
LLQQDACEHAYSQLVRSQLRYRDKDCLAPQLDGITFELERRAYDEDKGMRDLTRPRSLATIRIEQHFRERAS